MQNPKNEIKALASIMDNPDLLTRCTEMLFTEDRLAIFKAMKSAYTMYGYLTPETIESTYKGSLAEVLNTSAVVIEPILENLEKFARKRMMLEISQRTQELAQQDDPNMDTLQDILFTIEPKSFDTTLDASGMKMLQNLKAKIKGDYKFASTGIDVLDVAMGGEWPRKALSIIIADPGGSKTSLVCNSALRMGQNGNASLFFSLEMSKEELHQRWASDLCNIDNADIRAGKLKEDEYELIAAATNNITRLPIYVIDSAGLGITDMIPVIRRYHREHGIKVVFIDYLQIVTVGEDRNRGFGMIAKLLKEISKKLDIHICIISQKNGKDGVWSVRDSGDVPAAADIIMNIVMEDSNTDLKSVNIEFTKHRHGRTGTYAAWFKAPYMRYLNRR